MKLSIFLAEDTLRIVIASFYHKIKIHDCAIIDLPKGTVIQDVVIDETALKEALCEVRRRYKNKSKQVDLILGNKAVTKVIQVPTLSKKVLTELTKRELNNFVSKKEEMIYDASMLDGAVLCAALDRKTIENYIRIFAECNIKIRTINIALNTIVHMAEYLKDLRTKTYIMLVIEGRNLVLTLYEEGKYLCMSKVRLVAERDSKQSLDEILEHVYPVVQFHRSRESNYLLEQILVSGLSQEEANVLFPMLQNKFDIRVSPLEGTEEIFVADGIQYNLSDYLCPSGNVIKTSKNLDFMEAFKRSIPRERCGKLLRLVLILLPFLALSLLLTLSHAEQKQQQICKQNLEELEKRESQTKLYTNYEKDRRAVLKVVSESGQMNSALMEQVLEARHEKVWLSSVTFKNGILNITAETNDYKNAASYAKELEDTGAFDQVRYEGFQSKVMEQTGIPVYYFNVFCYIGGKQL